MTYGNADVMHRRFILERRRTAALETAEFIPEILYQDIATVAGSVAYLLASAAVSELSAAYFALEKGLRDMLRKQRQWGLGVPPQT